MFHSRIGIVHFSDASNTIRYSILNRESSVGKELLVFVIFRICLLKFSIALVVYIIRLISGGYLKKVDKYCQLSLQLLIAYEYLMPHLISNRSRADNPASSLAAVYYLSHIGTECLSVFIADKFGAIPDLMNYIFLNLRFRKRGFNCFLKSLQTINRTDK